MHSNSFHLLISLSKINKRTRSSTLAFLLVLSIVLPLVLCEPHTVRAAVPVNPQSAVIATPSSLPSDDGVAITDTPNIPAPAEDFQTSDNGTADKQTSILLFYPKEEDNSTFTKEPVEPVEFTQGSIESDEISRMISFAESLLGKSYESGAEGPNSFDCSGFSYFVLCNMGIKTGRCNAEGFSQINSWQRIDSIGELKVGDLVFFYPDDNEIIDHMAIYIGSGQIIHASANQGAVVISKLTDYYKRNFVCGRRVFQ